MEKKGLKRKSQSSCLNINIFTTKLCLLTFSIFQAYDNGKTRSFYGYLDKLVQPENHTLKFVFKIYSLIRLLQRIFEKLSERF